MVAKICPFNLLDKQNNSYGSLPFVQNQNIKCLTFFTVLKIILFTSWKSFVCIHKHYLSIYQHAIYTPPNFITMIICIERKKQSDYCQLNKPCSTSSWVSKKMIKNLILFFFFVFSDQWGWFVLTQIIKKHCFWWF